MTPPVTLLTDFNDFYVAAMRGVVASRTDAPVHDVFHRVPPQDVRAAAFILKNVAPYYPEGTVHCVVVDPGVGTDRRSLVVEAGGQYLVGPDNGVLVPTARELTDEGDEEPRYYDAPYENPESNTFHGRDVFAPQAARVADGGVGTVAGERVEPVALELVEPSFEGGKARAEVVYVDRFGNAVTNLSGEEVMREAGYGGKVSVNGRVLPFECTYADVATGEPLALVGSHGMFEVAANQASGADALGLSSGNEVTVRVDTKEE